MHNISQEPKEDDLDANEDEKHTENSKRNTADIAESDEAVNQPTAYGYPYGKERESNPSKELQRLIITVNP